MRSNEMNIIDLPANEFAQKDEWADFKLQNKATLLGRQLDETVGFPWQENDLMMIDYLMVKQAASRLSEAPYLLCEPCKN